MSKGVCLSIIVVVIVFTIIQIFHTKVHKLRERGLDFLKIPSTYYACLKENLSKSKTVVKEDMDLIEVCGILLASADKAYNC